MTMPVCQIILILLRQQRQKPWPRKRGYCEASLYPLGW